MRVGASYSHARLFRAKGIPTVVIGSTPRDGGGPDEHILVDELVRVAAVQALSAWHFLQVAK
ncbi:hypothetical protein AAL_01657 [Moelleriella libera RCEF 2490]|uniref:Uncharacterized protein n=1 Tax=Moelleriella libera RCEF 2490 TaxID=1081109 RepID=A0A166RKS9_9HYPO|nr:hypothetical protein AAL_01657 [Moelleriella libera RCEF 2490]